MAALGIVLISYCSTSKSALMRTQETVAAGTRVLEGAAKRVIQNVAATAEQAARILVSTSQKVPTLDDLKKKTNDLLEDIKQPLTSAPTDFGSALAQAVLQNTPSGTTLITVSAWRDRWLRGGGFSPEEFENICRGYSEVLYYYPR